ncbi:MAG TPA: T6SS immunity protein Tdi1 domain-containing protein [Frankiaceae bacterium]|nr:T6SS immunity protein Tdi1 domain-containing protein [Frankiaceae bacterium]
MGFLRRKQQPDVPVKLTRQFPPKDYAAALESWAFLDLEGATPLLTSQFGDVVLAREDGVYLLDVVAGTLTREWDDVDAMADALETPAGQERYLRRSLVTAAYQKGKVPDETQVYDFAKPPVLGGALTADNLAPTDFVVTVNLDGQIHEQVRDLPPGTTIRGFSQD